MQYKTRTYKALTGAPSTLDGFNGGNTVDEANPDKCAALMDEMIAEEAFLHTTDFTPEERGIDDRSVPRVARRLRRPGDLKRVRAELIAGRHRPILKVVLDAICDEDYPNGPDLEEEEYRERVIMKMPREVFLQSIGNARRKVVEPAVVTAIAAIVASALRIRSRMPGRACARRRRLARTSSSSGSSSGSSDGDGGGEPPLAHDSVRPPVVDPRHLKRPPRSLRGFNSVSVRLGGAQ